MNIFQEKYKHLQSELDEKGFVVLDILPKNIVDQLLDYYQSMPNAKKEAFGFHVTLDLTSAEKIEQIAQYIRDFIQPFTDEYFADYRFISPRFAVKEAHQNSLIPPHQDWSFVDESIHQSYNLWIAITPSTNDNGTLGFIPNSHRVLDNIRATPLPIYQVPFHDYAMELSSEIQYFPLQPGQALFFNSRIIHASQPNITDKARINIAVEMTSREAGLIHYYLSPEDGQIVQYDIEDNFFNEYSNAKLTKLYQEKKFIEQFSEVKRFKYKPKDISKKELLEQCSDKKKKRFFGFLKW